MPPRGRAKAKRSNAIVVAANPNRLVFLYLFDEPEEGGNSIYAGQTTNIFARWSRHGAVDSPCKLVVLEMERRIHARPKLKPLVKRLVPGLEGGVPGRVAHLWEAWSMAQFNTLQHVDTNRHGCNQNGAPNYVEFLKLIGTGERPKTVTAFAELIIASGKYQDNHNEPPPPPMAPTEATRARAEHAVLVEIAAAFGEAYGPTKELAEEIATLAKLASEAEARDEAAGKTVVVYTASVRETYETMPPYEMVTAARLTAELNEILAKLPNPPDPMPPPPRSPPSPPDEESIEETKARKEETRVYDGAKADNQLRTLVRRQILCVHPDMCPVTVNAAFAGGILASVHESMLSVAESKLDKEAYWIAKALEWRAWSFTNEGRKPAVGALMRSGDPVELQNEEEHGHSIHDWCAAKHPDLAELRIIMRDVPWFATTVVGRVVQSGEVTAELKKQLVAGYGVETDPFKTANIQWGSVGTLQRGVHEKLRRIIKGQLREQTVDDILSVITNRERVAWYKSVWQVKYPAEFKRAETVWLQHAQAKKQKLATLAKTDAGESSSSGGSSSCSTVPESPDQKYSIPLTIAEPASEGDD
jgi:hypothetical protein